jgi:hypothetical protein
MPEYAKIPERVFNTLGDIKYIYIVRDPVDRMISHYRHALYNRWIPDGTRYEDAIREIPSLKECSRYFYQMTHFLNYSNRDQWLVLSLEDLLEDATGACNFIFDFLDVNRQSGTSLVTENVTDLKRRSPIVNEYLSPFKDSFPQWSVTIMKSVTNIFAKKMPSFQVSEQLRGELMVEFTKDISQLEDFAGRDFRTQWSK